MLENLHVKNFAIIDEIDVDFGPHLNILTGETGAGKSILIGSVNIVLGARVSPEMIGRYGDSALVEAVFHVESQSAREKIRDCGVEPEEGEIIISRRITGSRSVNKINGVTVPVSTIRAISEYLIDIHGQHEHQSLLNEKRHRQIVDDFGGKELREQKEKVHDLYKQYRHTLQESRSGELSAEEQARRKDYLMYEIREIEEASLTEEEMQALQINRTEMEVDFEEGDSITVMAGIWKDTVGVIQTMNHSKQTAIINVDLFGRETPVEISFTDIKKM